MRATRFHGEGGGGLKWVSSSGPSVSPTEYFDSDWDICPDRSPTSNWSLFCLWSMMTTWTSRLGRFWWIWSCLPHAPESSQHNNWACSCFASDQQNLWNVADDTRLFVSGILTMASFWEKRNSQEKAMQLISEKNSCKLNNAVYTSIAIESCSGSIYGQSELNYWIQKLTGPSGS